MCNVDTGDMERGIFQDGSRKESTAKSLALALVSSLEEETVLQLERVERFH